MLYVTTMYWCECVRSSYCQFMVMHRTNNIDIMEKVAEQEKEVSYGGRERVGAPLK